MGRNPKPFCFHVEGTSNIILISKCYVFISISANATDPSKAGHNDDYSKVLVLLVEVYRPWWSESIVARSLNSTSFG